MDNQLFKLIGDAVKRAEKNNGDLTTKNLKYVVTVAKDLSQKSGVDFDELFAEGVIAMKKCEESYDPKLNDNFVKYCSTHVRGYMMNVINRQSSLVHIPANHLKGFKSGQEKSAEAASISYEHIDAMEYDTLGFVDDDIFNKNKYEILIDGINSLDENSRIAVKMKLRLDEYANLKKNNMKIIANELEVPVKVANDIYQSAIKKLTKYCRAEYNS